MPFVFRFFKNFLDFLRLNFEHLLHVHWHWLRLGLGFWLKFPNTLGVEKLVIFDDPLGDSMEFRLRSRAKQTEHVQLVSVFSLDRVHFPVKLVLRNHGVERLEPDLLMLRGAGTLCRSD